MRKMQKTTERLHKGIVRRLEFLFSLFRLPKRLLGWRQSNRIQLEAIKKYDYARCDKLIIFFIPDRMGVTGGALQIFALYRMLREMYKHEKTEPVICWLAGGGWDLHHYSGFENDVTIFPFNIILKHCKANCKIQLHLPEYAAIRELEYIGWQQLSRIKDKHDLKIDIMDQNTEVMLSPEQIEKIKRVIPDLTSTIANPAWASESERKRLGIPMHILPTWYYLDDAPWQPYESKQNLMIVSPDSDPNRELVLNAIQLAFPKLEIRVIKGIKYEEYVELEKAAKWSLTFGEGLDGYFYGPMLRGGVSFAVRNSTFEVLGLENIQTTYESYEDLAKSIVADIPRLDSKEPYEKYNLSIRESFIRKYGRDLTLNALAAFYKGEYSFP